MSMSDTEILYDCLMGVIDNLPDEQDMTKATRWLAEYDEITGKKIARLKARVAELEKLGNDMAEVISDLNYLYKPSDAYKEGIEVLNRYLSILNRAPAQSLEAHDARVRENMEPAPKTSLPNWSECMTRVQNTEYIKCRISEGGFGFDEGGHYANEVHKFIYEYDDADPYRSGWFMHRLERLINSVKSEALREFADNYNGKISGYTIQELWKEADRIVEEALRDL